MRYERTGRGDEIVEVWEGPTRCTGCGVELAYPHVHVGWVNCQCVTGGRGHATKICLDCNAVHHDPPCTHTDRRTTGNAYDL